MLSVFHESRHYAWTRVDSIKGSAAIERVPGLPITTPSLTCISNKRATHNQTGTTMAGLRLPTLAWGTRPHPPPPRVGRYPYGATDSTRTYEQKASRANALDNGPDRKTCCPRTKENPSNVDAGMATRQTEPPLQPIAFKRLPPPASTRHQPDKTGKRSHAVSAYDCHHAAPSPRRD